MIIAIVIILAMFILIIVFQIKNSDFQSHFQDYLIFFKIYENSRNVTQSSARKNTQQPVNDIQQFNNIEEYKTYDFQVSYKNIDFKEVNLLETIDSNTKVNEKIAPGTKGQFSIMVHANQNSKYQVTFESLNQKPYNLMFHLKGDNREYRTLEELQEYLKGQVNANQTKNIHICWEWKYETVEDDSKMQDVQDSIDGIYIQKYQFKIQVIGEAI